MSEKKRLSVPCHIKSLDEAQGIAEIIFSVFNVVDCAGERVVPGAMVKSFERKLPKGVWGHDWLTPVGKSLVAEEWKAGDERLPEELRPYGGAYTKAQFNLETQRGREAFSDLKFGSIDEFSFGYYVLKSRPDGKGIVDLTELDVVEWSPVLRGCNTLTALLSAKDAAQNAECRVQSAESNPTQIKSEHLGYYAEGDATMAAIRSLNSSLMWGPVWDCLYAYESEEMTVDERATKMAAAFDEFRDISLQILRAIMTTGGEAEKSAAESIKALYPNELPSLADGTFSEQLKAALAAVETCTERARGIKALREKDARNLSEERRAQIASLKTSLESLLAEVQPKADPQIVKEAQIRQFKRQQEMRKAILLPD